MESYEKINQEKELKQTIINAKNLINENPIIRMYEAIILYNSDKFLEAKKILEKVNFSAQDLKNESKRISTLAKCCDRIGENEKAYNYFLEANNLFLKLKNSTNNIKKTLIM